MIRSFLSLAALLIFFLGGCKCNNPPTEQQIQARRAGASILKEAIKDKGFFFVIPEKGRPISLTDIKRVFVNGERLFVLRSHENNDADQQPVAKMHYREVYEGNGEDCSLCQEIHPDMIVGGNDPRLPWVMAAYIQKTVTPVIGDAAIVPITCDKNTNCLVTP